MQADSVSIAKVFSSGGDIHYVLPYFQREYTWEKENWKTLLDDAMAVVNEIADDESTTGARGSAEHFLGSIVVIHDGMRGGTISALKLVDGQQRLISISLLLKALAKFLEPTQPHLARRIDKHLVNDDETGELFFKLLPTAKSGDRSVYCALMRGQELPDTTSKIGIAYRFFAAELADRLASGSEAEMLLRVILNAFQVVFINLGANESPYRIFESLNAKGRPLTQADLVRNYIAMMLPASAQERVFSNSWGKVEDLLKESRNVGRLPELTSFLRHYLAMHAGVLCDENHVYARFRDRVERDFKDPGALEAELGRIASSAKHYDRLLRPEGYSSEGTAAAMHRLNVLEISTGYPFLLKVSEAVDEGLASQADFSGMLTLLENYLVRRYLAREPVNFLSRLFPRLWSRLNPTDLTGSLKSILGTENYPSDARVLRALKEGKFYDSSALTRRRTILVLEAINRHLSVGSGGHTMLDGSATIEHVMPQTLSDEWKQSLGVMSEQVHKEFLQTMGNLTLVTADWNSALSNSTFLVKQAKLKNHALRLNSSYFDGTIAKWTRDEILERAEELGLIIISLWPSMEPAASPSGENSQTLLAERAEFDFGSLERVASKLGTPFSRISAARFAAVAADRGLIGLASRPYESNGRTSTGFWFGFRESQREFLRSYRDGWVAFECGNPEQTLLLSLAMLDELLPSLNTTSGSHWHVFIDQEDERLWFRLPLAGVRQDVTDYLIR